MKTRIDVSQLNELSPEEKDKLRGLWKPKRGDIALVTADTLGKDDTALVTEYILEYKMVRVDFVTGSGSYDQGQLTPLVDIGQMIELLRNEKGAIPIMEEYDDNTFAAYYPGEGLFIYKYELADALWEAVKSILRG